MTAPVSMIPTGRLNTDSDGMHEYNMRFFLPSKYKCAADAPPPTEPHVQLVDIPPRTVAVKTFAGPLAPGNVQKHIDQLVTELMKEGLTSPVHPDPSQWAKNAEVFSYNPPWTPNRLRTIEVVLPIIYGKEELLAEASPSLYVSPEAKKIDAEGMKSSIMDRKKDALRREDVDPVEEEEVFSSK